jgi:PadR family transcriptional regulator PadR
MTKQSAPRMTLPTQLVLRVLLADPAQEKYGLQVCTEAGLPSGTIHPILARLEGLGWLDSRWEDIDAREEGRPRRRYYRLTEDGAERARIALAQATTSVTSLGLQLRPAGGPA